MLTLATEELAGIAAAIIKQLDLRFEEENGKYSYQLLSDALKKQITEEISSANISLSETQMRIFTQQLKVQEGGLLNIVGTFETTEPFDVMTGKGITATGMCKVYYDDISIKVFDLMTDRYFAPTKAKALEGLRPTPVLSQRNGHGQEEAEVKSPSEDEDPVAFAQRGTDIDAPAEPVPPVAAADAGLDSDEGGPEEPTITFPCANDSLKSSKEKRLKQLMLAIYIAIAGAANSIDFPTLVQEAAEEAPTMKPIRKRNGLFKGIKQEGNTDSYVDYKKALTDIQATSQPVQLLVSDTGERKEQVLGAS